MLHILWMLLKIIGIILLIILGLLVLSVSVVLFVPLRYHGKAKAQGTLDSVKAELKFSWLLHLISGYVSYENKETKWQVHILWRKVNVGKDKSNEKNSKEETPEKNKTEELVEDNKEECLKETSTENKSPQDKDVTEKEITEKKTRKNKTEKQKKNIFQKIKYTFCEFCDKIKSLIKKKEKLQEFLSDEIHQSSFMRLKKEIWRLLRFLKPKKLILNLHFGFEDPSLTGKVLGVLCMLYPFYMDHVNLEPEFDEKILEGDAYIKGTVRGLRLFVLICNLIFDKNIKTTYKAIKNWKG